MEKIFITGDLMRPNPDGSANQLANINWLYALISRQLEKLTGIKPKKLLRESGRTDLGDWLKTEDINTPCWHLDQVDLRMADPKKTLIIGFELPKNSKHQLRESGFKYIDVVIHPIRFLDDIVPALQTSGLPVISDKFLLTEGDFYLHANLIKNEVKRIFPLDISENTALIIGQTKVDKSLFDIHKGFFSLLHFKGEIEDICRRYSNVLFKPHPYQIDPEVMSFMKKNKIKITNSNVYGLLANDNVKSIYAISSSVLYEAKYFEKEVLFFAQRSIIDYLPVKPDVFLTLGFWGCLLGIDGVVDEMWVPYAQHRLRRTLDSWWGHPESPVFFRDDLITRARQDIDFATNSIHKLYAHKIKRRLIKLLRNLLLMKPQTNAEEYRFDYENRNS